MPQPDTRFLAPAIEKLYGRMGTPFDVNSLHREYFIEYDVITTKGIGATQVVLCPGIPAPLSSYITDDGLEWDLRALAVKYSVTKSDQDETTINRVRVEFSTRMPPGGPPDIVGFGGDLNGAQENPELVPPTIKWDKEVVSRALPYDLTGAAFLNSAGQPLTPAPTFECSRAVLIITRNELSFNRQTATDYSYTVNSDSFLGAPPGCVRSDTPVADEEWLGSLPYYRVTYRLVFGAPKIPQRVNPIIGAVTGLPLSIGLGLEPPQADELESWQPQFLDQGTMRKVPLFGVNYACPPIPIYGYMGPVTHPVLLDGAGQPAKIGGDPKFPTEITPKYLQFIVYRSKSFTSLLRGAAGRAGG